MKASKHTAGPPKANRDQQWNRKACLCPRFVASPRNRRPFTSASGSHCLPSWKCHMCASGDAVYTTALTWMPGSTNIRVSEGGPERKTYGPS